MHRILSMEMRGHVKEKPNINHQNFKCLQLSLDGWVSTDELIPENVG
jgi:hypothetical protein